MDPTTAVTATPPAPLTAITGAAAPEPKGKHKPAWMRALEVVASLRVTVVLFVLSILLIFFGTLAQVDKGIHFIVNEYFRTAFVWVPLQIFFPRHNPETGAGFEIDETFLFPGGWLLGGLLLANLLAAHAIRFKVNWRRSGILLIHAGLIVMMLGELFTGLFAVEGRMTIYEKGASNFTEDYHHVELAFNSTADGKTDSTAVVPDTLLRQGETIRHDALPCDVEVLRYMQNSEVLNEVAADKTNPATHGMGRVRFAEERTPVTGTDQKQTVDTASAYVNLKDRASGKSLGTYLLSVHVQEQPVVIGGKTYDVALRFKRTYKPYTIQLFEAKQVNWPGTTKPRWFSSDVEVIDTERGDKRRVLISMNDPLRYRGETFFQSGMERGVTILQVVENPSWLLPYISCAMVTIGMIVHFSLMLSKFLEQRGRAVS